MKMIRVLSKQNQQRYINIETIKNAQVLEEEGKLKVYLNDLSFKLEDEFESREQAEKAIDRVCFLSTNAPLITNIKTE